MTNVCFRSLAVLIVTVVFASLSWSQCPVNLNFFDSYAIWGAERSLLGGPSTGPRPTMVLKATNVGDKEISAMEFKVAFLDYTLTEHDDWYQGYQWHGHFKQGKDMKARWERAILFDRPNYPYARIRLIKVLYADESLWRNDGTCAEQWDRGYLKTHNKASNLDATKQEDEDSAANKPTQNSSVRTTKPNDPATSVYANPQTSATSTLTANLDVSSTPPNADIEVDGGFVGNTPSSIGLASGEHTVKITKSGYKPWERKVRTSTGAARLVAELEAMPPGYVPAPATKPWSLDSALGIKTKTTDIAGAEISEITSGSVADHAGLHVGDVINSIDGKAIGTPEKLGAELSNRAPGTKIRIGYMVRTSLGAFSKEATLTLPR